MFCAVKRMANGATRQILLAGAVALLIASWGGVAQADGGGGGLGAPELSLGALGSALTLLAGGLMLVRERFRSR